MHENHGDAVQYAVEQEHPCDHTEETRGVSPLPCWLDRRGSRLREAGFPSARPCVLAAQERH